MATHAIGNGRLGRWSRLAFLILVPLMLAALAFWFGTEYRRLRGNEDEAQRAHQRQLLISELFSSIKDAETGQRGYVLTGNDAFLEPYRDGQAMVEQRFAQLGDYRTSAAERLRLDRIKGLVDAKFSEMERVMAARRTGGLAAAAAMVSAGRGKVIMDDIRREATAARTAEAAALARSISRQSDRTRSTERIMWIGVGITALAFLLIALFVRRMDRERLALTRETGELDARRRAIFDSTLDALILINPSGSIETINRSATRLFGYSDHELIRRDIALLVDLAPGEGPFLERLGLGPEGLAEPFRHRIFAKRADGTTVPVEAALGVMPLPDGIHIVAALRDISEREKTERIKDQFLSTVSHELRTPLTSIIGALGLLRGGVSGDMTAGVQRLLVIAETNAARLIRLVNDLLDIEKFESGAMAFDFAPAELGEIAGRAIDAVRGTAETDGVTLEFDGGSEPSIVRGDADRLIQVMNNLLANAVRFTPTGGKVSLSVRRRAGHAEVSIADEGPGIDDELRGRLFTRFAQSMQSSVGASRGTGLGLAISREIVRSHGGSIWYQPAPGGGSVFSFSLPLWDAITDQPDIDGAPRVLICAGEREVKAIVGALEHRSVRADVIASGEDVQAALARRTYLALLLDCHCQGVAGGALLQSIRANPATRNLPIIAVASGDLQAEPAFASLDLVDWIPRPIEPARLNDALGSVVDRAMGTMPLVLHVDDDTDTLELTSSALAGRARIARATDLASARQFIKKERPDVVIIDLALPDGSGETLVGDLAACPGSAPPVIIYSAQELNGEFGREVSAVLTKSKRSLSALVETIIDILGRQNDGRGEDER